MTDFQALEIVVGRTGHKRYRQLVDPTHPDYDHRYLELVRQLAAGQVPAQPADPPRGRAVERIRLMLACEHRGPLLSRGCQERRMCFARSAPVTSRDCLECVSSPADVS
jgi:hypothetical protein